MKKTLLVIGMSAMLITSTSGLFTASAQQRHHRDHKKHENSNYKNNNYNYKVKQDAQQVLRRTATVLQRVQGKAKDQGSYRRHQRRNPRGENARRYSGLGRAFAFQQRAKDLYSAGDYENAIQLSLRSRAIALQVERQMNAWDKNGWVDDRDDFRRCDMDRSQMDNVELRYWDRRSDDSRYDVMIKGCDIDDDSAISFMLSFDF